MQSQLQKFTRQRLSAGYVHVYTGNGKGKTTAAIGLAIRAAGAGLRVLFTQFIKGSASSEIDALKVFSDQITVRHYGRGRFIRNDSCPEDCDAAEFGLAEIERALSEGDYDMIVLDEANMAIQCHLFSVDRLIDLIASKPLDVEIVITGRDAHPSLLDYADVVTEMREIKHYYHKGIMGRVGIEK